MTLETAKKILEELPQDKSESFKYRLRNYSIIREAEAVCRGGFNYCEYKENGGRVYLYLKIKPTMTDEESSIELAIETYRKRKQPKKNRVELRPKEEKSTPEIDEPKQTSEQEPAPILPRLISTLKRKFSNFVKVMDEIVDE